MKKIKMLEYGEFGYAAGAKRYKTQSELLEVIYRRFVWIVAFSLFFGFFGIIHARNTGQNWILQFIEMDLMIFIPGIAFIAIPAGHNPLVNYLTKKFNKLQERLTGNKKNTS